MICPNCGFDCQDNPDFCPECGTQLKSVFQANPYADNEDTKKEDDNVTGSVNPFNSSSFSNTAQGNTYNQPAAPLEQNGNNQYEQMPQSQDYMNNQQPVTNGVGFTTGNTTGFDPNAQANYMQPPKSGIGIGAVGIGVILKAILCAIFPIPGFIVSFLSKNKGHRLNSKIYLFASIIGIVLSMIIGLIAGNAISKKVEKELNDYNSSYSTTNWEYSNGDDEETEKDADDSSESQTTAASSEASSENTTEGSASANATASYNWKDPSVIIDGKEVKLPCKWTEFKKITGYDFDPSHKDFNDLEETLENGDYTLTNYISKGNSNLEVWFQNNTGKDGVGYNEWDVMLVRAVDKSANIVFPCEYKVGDKITDPDSLASVMGETPEISTNGNTCQYQFYDINDNNSVFYYITTEKNVITEIEIENEVTHS